ncbi:hypothetical protein MFUM_150001 [Methylacidiphilum fumariolicum SolV]|uniref:Uncharacterized protein n=2 Tax=Candidatus Methylacidiphilum fumarolicum TaxID=591154 RepID=I0JWG0_METFB|nr:hypothetical protein [Candidatus Methylacidiphilum fumarolicum]CAI9085634.1 conserved protein of unknown function [Candidatus Methylacidiphilum fumarolicum]CCG91579.1 hypothetical protein MFUM_150001 [Methylacidiphilum fumariolicum SolV]
MEATVSRCSFSNCLNIIVSVVSSTIEHAKRLCELVGAGNILETNITGSQV